MDYKVYVLDGAGRISSPPVVIECVDDQDAIQKAKEYLDGATVEIWHDTKLIAKLEPKS